MTGLPPPYGAPNASSHVERFIGSLRRERLVHFTFISDRHLRPTVGKYVAWHTGGRGHQGTDGIPDVAGGLIAPRKPPPGGQGRLVSRPVLSGLAHDHELAA